MSWIYEVASATFISPNGQSNGAEYSGARGYYNNSEYECLINSGPIPRGRYTIRPPHNSPNTLALTPHQSNNMCGRNSFAIHGDSQRDPGGASQGCIIASPTVRRTIIASLSTDNELIVR